MQKKKQTDLLREGGVAGEQTPGVHRVAAGRQQVREVGVVQRHAVVARSLRVAPVAGGKAAAVLHTKQKSCCCCCCCFSFYFFEAFVVQDPNASD